MSNAAATEIPVRLPEPQDMPRPLGDPLLSLRVFLGRLVLWGTGASACLIGLYFLSHVELFLILPVVFLTLIVPTVVFIWRLLPNRITNAFYLRSFQNDPQTWPIRKEVQATLNAGFRLSGIRDPGRRRSPLDYVGLFLFVLRYCTPKFMNLEAGADWKARLWRSLGNARCAFIDISTLTPFVAEEIELCFHCLGIHRLLFIGDETQGSDEWKERVAKLLPTGLDRNQPVHVAIWNRTDRRKFRDTVHSFALGLPGGVAELNASAFSMTRTSTFPIAPEPSLHDWKFWIVSPLISILLTLGIDVLSSALIPGLMGRYTFAYLAMVCWMFIGYVIDCGSHRERILCTLSLVLPVSSVLFLYPAVARVREAEQRSIDMRALSSLGLALHGHHKYQGSFPAGTKMLDGCSSDQGHSWMLYLLPYTEDMNVFEEVHRDEPWDSPFNSGISRGPFPPKRFDPGTYTDGNKTPYVGIAGIGLEAAWLPMSDNNVGVFGYQRATRLRDITDGTDCTIMVMETRRNRGPWMAGGTATVRGVNPSNPPYVGSEGQFGREGGGLALYANGAVGWISDSIHPQVFESLATIHGEERVPVEYKMPPPEYFRELSGKANGTILP